MRKLSLLTVAAAVLAGTALTGCGAAPGSVAGDPLAAKLIDAEKKTDQWDAVGLSMVFHGDGALSGTALPCFTLTAASRPTETFSMNWVKNRDYSSDTCSGAESDTVQIDYADSTLYVSDPDTIDNGCATSVTSHRVTGALAEKFVAEQTNQVKLAELMKAATKISGDDHRISVDIDTEAMLKLGTTSIPSGVDPDDIDVTADVTLDGDGALSEMQMKINADNQGSLTIYATYHKAEPPTVTPDPKCVTKGSPASSTTDIAAFFS